METNSTAEELQEQSKELLKELRTWSNHEFSLIDSRIMWLLTSSALLFASLAIFRNQESLGWFFMYIISFTGFIISVVNFWLVLSATQTIKNICSREKKLLALKENSLLRIMYPDEECTLSYPSTTQERSIPLHFQPRGKSIHKQSLYLTISIPVLVGFFWLALMIYYHGKHNFKNDAPTPTTSTVTVTVPTKTSPQAASKGNP